MKKRVLSAGLVVFSVVLVLFTVILPIKSSSAATFDKLFVFGDSLSDPGNVFNVTDGEHPSSPPYPNGRFSNGDVWADYTGRDLGLTPTLVTELNKTGDGSQGINFAFGSAKTGKGGSRNDKNIFIPSSLTQSPVIPSIQEQVQDYLGRGQKPDPNALYAIWGGTNDYGANIDPNIVVDNLSNDVRSLAEAGAKNILVFNLPNLGQTPSAIEDGSSEQMTVLSTKHNAKLASSLSNLSSTLNANIIPVDIHSLFNQVQANPPKFGFQHFIEPCVVFDGNDGSIKRLCSNPDDFFFFDYIHPTTKVHKLVADTVLSAIKAKSIPESSTALSAIEQ